MGIQFFVALAIIVGLHEWGHMFAAKRFKMRVEKFYIFMPPKLFSKKIGETEYGIGTIPLGGFVKISGMIDESMDKEQMAKDPEPWEFRSKPAWQRLIVMLGGIIVNLITGILIFIGLNYYNGESYIPIENVKYGIFAGDLAQEMGLKTGDQIIALNGTKITEFEQIISSKAFLEENSFYTIIRNGEELRIDIPNDFLEKLAQPRANGSFISPLTKFVVAEVADNSAAQKAGLLAGDKIIEMEGSEVNYFETFSMDKMKFLNQTISLKILRNEEYKMLSISLDSTGIMGFIRNEPVLYSRRYFSFFEAVSVGFNKAMSIIFDTIKGFSKIGKGQISASNAISGPFEMAQMFGGSFNSTRFWTMCGLISMALGFMNLLPIPALDGGHVMFLTYEIITGKKPPVKFMEYAQIIGMILLFSIMIFAVFNGAYKTFIR